MKLVVQIPCYNEAETIAETIKQVPRKISGIDEVLVLVIDDASEDGTGEIAKKSGADLVVRLKERSGLARAFMVGMEKALKMGAEVLVNTDGDNQYPGEEIPRLIEPIIKGEAEVVVGERRLRELKGYSWFRFFLQRLGSWFVEVLSGVEVKDAASGFRAFSREAGLRLSVLGEFSYTIESLIEAGRNGWRIGWVPVRVNPQPGRRSRLYRNLGEYLIRSVETMIRTYSRYEPLRVFLTIGIIIFLCGFGIGVWFLYYYFTVGGRGHIQILILSAVLMIIGFQTGLIGLLADLIAGNRKLLEELIYRIRRLEHQTPDQKL